MLQTTNDKSNKLRLLCIGIGIGIFNIVYKNKEPTDWHINPLV